MSEPFSFFDDASELQDDVLLRKIVECRRQLRQLSAYRSREIARVSKHLAGAVARMEAEAERRSLPIRDVGAFGKSDSIRA